jgi:peptidoglycan/LPS O-acetylase OafA/YrhL
MRHNNFNLIRLLAAVQVLVVHALNHFEVEGLAVSALKLVPGVPVFFILSGYLIFDAYDRTRVKGLGVFARNRALRIFPALWLCVGLSTLIVVLSGYLSDRSFSPLHFAAWLLGQSSIFQFYNPTFMRGFGVGVLNGALWTISVELQFYLLTPFLFWLIAKRNAALYLLIGASLATNMFLRVHYDWSDLRVKLASVSFLPWVYMYLLGMLVSSRKASVESLLARVPLWLIASAYVASMLLIGSYADNASNAINPVSTVLIAMLLFTVAKRDLRLPQFLAGFVRRNDLSYGIYLYHMPMINIVLYRALMPHAPLSRLAIVLVASVILAGLSWFLLERRALVLKG